MKFFADRSVRMLFALVFAALVLFTVLTLWMVQRAGASAVLPVSGLAILFALVLLALLVWYFRRQSRLIDKAIARIRAFLAGDVEARIDSDEEGELYRLFHEINAMAAILGAHAENEANARAFLKDTLSDISHQLKTPLATLGIYNGILQEATDDSETVREFSALSEQELDRIEALVKNLLTISRLDAGTLVFKREPQMLSEMMGSLERHFAFRAEQEGKTLCFSGEKDVTLVCDRLWILEALTNIVKNALDHTTAGCTIAVNWRRFGQIVQITVRDDGSGIHPEDLPHIFKRFYRSRFSLDTQGVGLGLPLAKAIIEAHSGTVEVDSALGEGTVFTINFLIPTEL